MSVIITLEANIKKKKKENLLSMLREFLPQTRTYKGFIDISIHIQKESNHVLFFEEWKSIEDYESYLSWRSDRGVMDKLLNVFEEVPTIRYYDTKDI